MIMLQKNEGAYSEPNAEYAKRTELQKKWLAYQRFFNVRRARINFAALDPVMTLLLNHFYGTEILDSHKFHEVELTNMIMSDFFDDIELRNLP